MPKGARKIDMARLKDSLAKAEEKGGLKNLGKLWEAVAAQYNVQVPANMKPIAASLAKQKITEEDWPIKTISGKGKAAVVDSKLLQQCIILVEADGLPPNRGELFKKVAEKYAADPRGAAIPFNTLQQIANKSNLTIETPKGKVGRQAGEGFPAIKRVKKADKFAADPVIVESIKAVIGRIPLKMQERHANTIEKFKQGSRTAAVKLNCLECSNWQGGEVRLCVINSCAMYPFRPYQGNSVDADDDEQDTGDEAVTDDELEPAEAA